MAKVKCLVCDNEVNAVCKIKKIGVKINRPRLCDAFVYNESKLKTAKDVPVIRYGYADKMRDKAFRKEEAIRIKEAALQKAPEVTPAQYIPRVNTQYPLTGDLSRFVSSAAKDD